MKNPYRHMNTQISGPIIDFMSLVNNKNSVLICFMYKVQPYTDTVIEYKF